MILFHGNEESVYEEMESRKSKMESERQIQNTAEQQAIRNRELFLFLFVNIKI